jgi:hypothetical protein
MSLFGRLKGFLGPSLGQRLSQVNQNKINNFVRKKLSISATQAFDTLNNKTKLALINAYRGSLNTVNKSDINTFRKHQNALRGPTNYGQVGRRAAAAFDVAARHGAVGLAAPIALAGNAGYQGGRAAAAAARAAAEAASKKYRNVTNTVSAKYSKLSGRNTNQRVANLNAKVKTLEARVISLEGLIR